MKLHRAQSRFRRSTALYRGFVGGRGSGKTWAGAFDLIRRARPGRTYLVGSPTGILLGDTTFPTFKALAKSFGIWGGVKLTPYPNAVLLLDGGEATIRFRTAEDPERMRGPNLSGVWLDEASLMHEDAYKIVIACLREGGRQGWLSATFTPKGPTHWTAATFARGKPDTAVFHATTGANPFNPPGFAATLAKQYDSQYARQELGGEFISLAGAAFPPHYFEGDELYFTDWPDNLVWRVIGCDPSSASGGDYWAYALVGISKPKNIFWVDAELSRTGGAVQMIGRGLDLARRFAPLDSLAFEDNAGMGLLRSEIIRQANAREMLVPLSRVVNTKAKEERVRSRLGAYLDQRRFRFRRTPGCELLVNQLRDFPFSEGGDDGPDALELAVREIERLVNR